MGRGDILTKKGKWVGQYHGHEGVDLRATYLPEEGKWGSGDTLTRGKRMAPNIVRVSVYTGFVGHLYHLLFFPAP